MKPKRPYAQPDAKRRNVYMDEQTFQRLKAIGEGNVSKGIRKATEAYEIK